MKALVINLDRNPERWTHFQGCMKGYIDDVVRIPAVDGRLLTDKWQYLSRWMYLTHEPNKFNIMPAIGCFLSHQKCWHYIVDHDLPYALVLEDDTVPTSITNEFLEAFQASPAPVDWLKLHTHRYPGRDPQKPIGISIGGQELCVNPKGSKSNGAYILSNVGARKLIGLQKMFAPVDHLEWLRLLNSITYAQTQNNVFQVAESLGTNISPNGGNILLRLPAIVRIGILRMTICKAVAYSNLVTVKKLCRQSEIH